MEQGTLTRDDGSTLHYYDNGPADGFPVFWLHGTPNLGSPPEPLFGHAAALGLRWLGYDRPGYGGSTPRPGRNIASAADDVARIADRLGIERFAVIGQSGGGPHVLACAARLPGRVTAAVSIAGLAPYGAADLDWFAGMRPSGVAGLRAALAGREAKAAYLADEPEFDPEMFTPADWTALDGPWSWFHSVVQPALAGPPDGMIDDDVAYVSPWGFDCADIAPPVLLVHGGQDRMVPVTHSQWLARACPYAELWHRPDDGHLSVMSAAPDALRWIADRLARPASGGRQ